MSYVIFFLYVHVYLYLKQLKFKPTLKIFWFAVYQPTTTLSPRLTIFFVCHLHVLKNFFFRLSIFFSSIYKQFNLKIVSFSWTGSKKNFSLRTDPTDRPHYFQTPLMDLVHVCYDDRYWIKILLCTIPTPMHDLKVKVTVLELLC